MKTFSLKPKDVTRQWYILDASEAPMGRVATAVARLLLGKDKPSLSPHVDGGDYVVVINSDHLIVTGNKRTGKIYYRHSGFPGGLKRKTLGEMADTNSETLIHHAIRGMLPDNKLRAGRLVRLKIYKGAEHKHHAQNPQPISLKADKNQK